MKLTPTPDTPKGPETIRLDMTWRAAAQILGAILTDGTPEGQASARVELARMAEAADRARELAETLAAAREALRPLASELIAMQPAAVSREDAAARESALRAFRILTGAEKA